MNVLWSKQVKLSNLWPPECAGVFRKQENIVVFFFKYGHNLLAVSEEDINPRLLCSRCGDDPLPLPRRWTLVETPNEAFLLVTKDRGYDLKNNKFSNGIPMQLQMAYSQHFWPEKYHVDTPQQLGEFTILHKGNWGYICKKGDAELWEFKGKAYLYTNMMRWKDRLFFGTGGQGGYFYVLDINNGLPLASIKTGGTECIVHVDNLCYILKNEKNAKLLCVDLSDGRTVSECELPGIAKIESRITMIDNQLHVITFNVSRSIPNGFTWSCVKM